MYPGQQARQRGDKTAVVLAGAGSGLTYSELNHRSTQLARALRRRGLGYGSTVAVVLENRVEWPEVLWGPLRSGMWVAPLNWHLGVDELRYLLTDSKADAVITSQARVAELGDVLDDIVARVLVMDRSDSCGEDYELTLAAEGTGALEDERLGARLLYSSGTTGRPKAIRQELVDLHPASAPVRLAGLVTRLGMDADSVFLNAAPAYHAAPFQFGLVVNELGGTLVHLAKFDAEAYLAAVQEHHVTHAQVVPTMLVRMLRLPEQVRRSYDLSSLSAVITSGAPCSAPLKQAVTDWLGPVVHEYYGASEGYGATHVGPREAAERPGTVGTAIAGTLHITDDGGAEVPPRQVGQVWFEGTAAFSYEGDELKSSQARNDRGWTTVGDLGWLDEGGFLYLTGRTGHTIISGGVNIYPQEIEDVLVTHPSVVDVAVIGVPDAEYGEAVKALVELVDGAGSSPDLTQELMELCRARLARFKAPKSIDVVARLPRLPSGKLNKTALRAPFWPDPAAEVHP
jgi:long-chain acyl-CoA synthetase